MLPHVEAMLPHAEVVLLQGGKNEVLNLQKVL